MSDIDLPPGVALPPLALPGCARRWRQGTALRVTAFGSSTTEGIGASSPDLGFAGVMQRTLRAGGVETSLCNCGVGGDNAVDLHARLDAVIADSPDLVLLQTGSNDPLQEVPLARFEQLTREDIARLQGGTGAEIVLIDQQYCRALEECPAFPDFLDCLGRIGTATGLAVFPRYRLMRAWCGRPGLDRDRLSPDGLHMGDHGYGLLGRALAGWLRGALTE